jgi:hypothetical protein
MTTYDNNQLGGLPFGTLGSRVTVATKALIKSHTDGVVATAYITGTVVEKLSSGIVLLVFHGNQGDTQSHRWIPWDAILHVDYAAGEGQ